MVFKEKIDPEALRAALSQVQKRYPYYSVRLRQEGETYVLEDNPEPFVLSEGNLPICLGSPASNHHLIAFAWDENVISVDTSHFICDGNGIFPLLKTLMYYYVSRLHGDSTLTVSEINRVEDPIAEEEYAYPYPSAPLPVEEEGTAEQAPAAEPEVPFTFPDSFFEETGSYAYHLQINENDLVERAKENGGSPVSFFCAMLFHAARALFPEDTRPVIFEIPHQYRKALGRPLTHECVDRVLFVSLPPQAESKPLTELNADLRAQIKAGAAPAEDVKAINGMIQLDGYLGTMPLAAKKQTMAGLVGGSMHPFTFGVSYTGKVSWSGLETYLTDVYPYAGEQKRNHSIGLEIFSLGDRFAVNIMHQGKNPALAQQLLKQFEEQNIQACLTGESAIQMPDYQLPE